MGKGCMTAAGLDGETATQRHVLRHVAVSPARLKVKLSLWSWLRESVRQTGARHRGRMTPGQPLHRAAASRTGVPIKMSVEIRKGTHRVPFFSTYTAIIPRNQNLSSAIESVA